MRYAASVPRVGPFYHAFAVFFQEQSHFLAGAVGSRTAGWHTVDDEARTVEAVAVVLRDGSPCRLSGFHLDKGEGQLWRAADEIHCFYLAYLTKQVAQLLYCHAIRQISNIKSCVFHRSPC